MIRPTLKEFKRKARRGNLIPVYTEILADLETPVSAFMKIENGRNSFLLESVEGPELVARYSFLGSDPMAVLTAPAGGTEDPLSALERTLRQFRPVPDERIPPFSGGAVGFLGYDAVRFFERVPFRADKNDRSIPDAVFLLADKVLAFDHFRHTIQVIVHAYLRPGERAETVYSRACRTVEGLVRRLQRPLVSAGRTRPGNGKVRFTSNFRKSDYLNAVARVKEYIRAGEGVQMVLSQRFQTGVRAHPIQMYRALRSINPSPYMFYFQADDLTLIGASPEMLVRVQDGTVETRPIAGTRPRGADPALDKRMSRELQADPKERAEHVMLVDLGRNDIGRVCTPGSVHVPEFMQVEKFSHVMHLVSSVKGKLRPGLTRMDALRACFPAGTVSGAPKVRAMEIIHEMEPVNRGPYAGAVGYFSFDGNMDTCIAIRTIAVHHGQAYLQAGGGIVADSRPEREYQETLNKARAMMRAVEMAEEGL